MGHFLAGVLDFLPSGVDTLQERLSAAAADGYNMAVEKLIARAEALRPKPIREQMANAAKEAAKENATRPAPAKGKEARDDR